MRLGITRTHRLGAALLASSALVVAAPAVAPAQAATVKAPSVTATGAFLLDSTANKALWSKAADTKRQMASTTKVMTAAVVLGTPHLDLNKKITIKQAYRDYVVRNGASTADLKTGDTVTVKQLLYALMLPSGCDAAMALADTYGTGSTVSARTSSFIKKMNSTAAALKMKNTKYDSFDGISSAGSNYTTPRDAAVLARKAMSYANFRDVVKTAKSVQKATNGRTYTWYNTNKLLGAYSGAVGVKTGTGTSAGPCLIFAATRNGRTIVGVLLHSSTGDNRFADATKMLNYAFGTSSRSAAGTLRLRSLPAGAQRD
ncbi:D-alanyl-D-alanine carboxypeptidase family protein [Streptomyces sp. MI02-7b]|uniref:D-alanyl-D-alanine carboxypeptidase family protein n=1 Tax=Streptomyces sp. MI02-7b TaxID=462941 RepID=UPI0029AB70B0|nr:serine hydrolase [Streptomyces sp. MI02-7b]MDX3072020.1 serine hydrolase [Streptomyces sp. MI02-7b]